MTEARGGTPSNEVQDLIEPGMYWFILGDMSVFAVFFGACLLQAGEDRTGFALDAGRLSLSLGFLNTVILIWSSLCVALAVQACRARAINEVRRNLRRCMLSAAAFTAIKSIEYIVVIREGHGLTTSTFFSYYFVLTGLHLLHIVIGTTFLGIAYGKTRSGALPTRRFFESSAAYWHMVDLLWLLIYALLYVGANI